MAPLEDPDFLKYETAHIGPHYGPLLVDILNLINKTGDRK